MKQRLRYLILPVITLILECLPNGAVLLFANPEGEPWKETFPYFSLEPFGFANFAPLITALMTCLIFFLLILYCFTGNEKWAVKAKNILCVCIVFSFGPLVFGIRFFSVVGLLISLSLIAQFLLLHRTIKVPDEEPTE